MGKFRKVHSRYSRSKKLVSTNRVLPGVITRRTPWKMRERYIANLPVDVFILTLLHPIRGSQEEVFQVRIPKHNEFRFGLLG